MKNKSFWLSLLAIASMFCSCADLIDFKEPTDLVPADSLPVSLLQQELYIMVGDSCTLDVQIPDTVSMTYYCTLDPGQSLMVKGRSVYALEPGDQEVSVHVRLYDSLTVSHEKVLTCQVHAFSWQADSLFADFPYSMILYCQVTIDGAAMSDRMEMAALAADGQVRGRAQWLQDGAVRYVLLRIYSPVPEGETIYLYCYDHTRVQRIALSPASISFEDLKTQGTLSHLYQISGSFSEP